MNQKLILTGVLLTAFCGMNASDAMTTLSYITNDKGQYVVYLDENSKKFYMTQTVGNFRSGTPTEPEQNLDNAKECDVTEDVKHVFDNDSTILSNLSRREQEEISKIFRQQYSSRMVRASKDLITAYLIKLVKGEFKECKVEDGN